MPATSPSARRRALQPAFDIARCPGRGRDRTVRHPRRRGRRRGRPAGVVHRDGRPRIGTDAICLLASITKPIVATAVVQQVEAGRIDLATPIGTWAPHLVNERWAPVTAWHVLTHTSGIDDIDLEAILRHGEGREDMLRHIAKVGQLTPPGSTFHYASFPFDVLAEAARSRARAGRSRT